MNTLFAFVLLLSILIFVHELGHFLVARWCGVRVLQFSIGFGRAIGLGSWRLAWKWGDTEYKIGWFPMGGYVKMLGEHLDMIQGEEPPAPDAPRDQYLDAKTLWQKLAIVSAGPAMNLILPVIVFVGMLSVGMPRALPVVGSIEAGSPAEQAGLLEGDRLTALGSEPVAWWADVEEIVRDHAGQSLVFAFEREGEARNASVQLETRSRFDEFGTDGIVVGKGKAVAFLSKVISHGGKLFNLDVKGTAVSTTPYEGESGTINVTAGFHSRGSLQAAIISDGTNSYNVAGMSNVTVPVGDYRIVSGFVGKGPASAAIRAGKMSPIAVKADKDAKLTWGGKVTAEFTCSADAGKVSVDPKDLHYYGRAGEEYYDLNRNAKSPRFTARNPDSGQPLGNFAFAGC